ncbi:MAG TPA: extracellular solute-binding protein [Kofleriaceae bacterium]|nr:extracellular solute-binding protein [Kofleriaceae bacterium]
MRWPVVLVLAACGHEPAAPPPIHFLHTFDADETELFNSTMAERGLAVDSSLVPFARGQQVISEILRAGEHCPDLIRIDATWLPELVAARLVVAPPAALVGLDWTPEARALGELGGAMWGVPQTVDGLVVVRDADLPAPRDPSVDALVAAARAVKTPQLPYPLAVRVDGYWLVPWLRGAGVELAPGPGIDGDGARRALAAFAALFGDLVAPPPAAGGEAPEELRRWRAHEVAYWVTGPWQVAALRDRDRVAVSPLAHAPRGGQLLVVPACSAHPADGWRLASELTSVTVELIFADAFATVPTRASALDSAPPLARAQYEALRSAEMLPRSTATPLLFDDLNPALAAVVSGDATAAEAIAGVRRGWHRLVER